MSIGTSTYRFACKCLKCGLHFNVYSWSRTWYADHEVSCPECGVKGVFLLDTEPVDGEIYHYVSA